MKFLFLFFCTFTLSWAAAGDPCSYSTGDLQTPGFSARVHQWAIDNSPGECRKEVDCTALGPFAAEGSGDCNPPPYTSLERCCMKNKLWPCADRTNTEDIKYGCFDKDLCVDPTQDIKGTVEQVVGLCPGSANMKCCKVDCQYQSSGTPTDCTITNGVCMGNAAKTSVKNGFICPALPAVPVACSTCCEHEAAFGTPTGCTVRADSSCRGTASKAVKAGSASTCQPLVDSNVLCPGGCGGGNTLAPSPSGGTQAPSPAGASCDRAAHADLWVVDKAWAVKDGSVCSKPDCEVQMIQFWTPKTPLSDVNKNCPRQSEEKVEACVTGDCAPIEKVDCKLKPREVQSSWVANGNCFWEDNACKNTFTLQIETQPSGGGVACPDPDSADRVRTTPCLEGDSGCPDKDAKIDCVVHYIENWSDCDPNCGPGQRTRTQVVKNREQNGGAACPTLDTQSENCNNGPCPDNTDVVDPNDIKKNTKAPAATGDPNLAAIIGGSIGGALCCLIIVGVIVGFLICWARADDDEYDGRDRRRDTHRSRSGTRRSRSGTRDRHEMRPSYGGGTATMQPSYGASVTQQQMRPAYGQTPNGFNTASSFTSAGSGSGYLGNGNVGAYPNSAGVNQSPGYPNSAGAGAYPSQTQSMYPSARAF